jgi:hypothetical protein
VDAGGAEPEGGGVATAEGLLAMPTKPTGETGPLRVTATRDTATLDWEKTKFSSKKNEIEDAIITLFVDAMRKTGATIHSVERNQESDLDYRLRLPGGDIALELTEFVYVDSDGPPYESRNQSISTVCCARQLADRVLSKAARYGDSKNPSHLLVYVTHWRFVPGDLATAIAQHFLQDQQRFFENVFLLTLLDNETAHVRLLYPVENSLDDRSVEEFQDHSYFVFDPSGFELVAKNPSLKESK